MIPAGGFGFNVPALAQSTNQSTLTSLASLQQSELGNLLARYQTGALYQTAGAVWGLGYAVNAAATRTILRGMCRGRQLQAAADAAAQAAAAAAAQPPAPSTEQP
jgi:hypothetical protein